MLARGIFLQYSDGINSIGFCAFIYNIVFICVTTLKVLRVFVSISGKDQLPKGSRGSGKTPTLFEGKMQSGLSLGPEHRTEHITLGWGPVWGCLSLLFQKMLEFSFPSCPSNSPKQLPRSFLKQWQVWDLLRQKGNAAGFSHQRSSECAQVLPARCRDKPPGAGAFTETLELALLFLGTVTWVHGIFLHTGNPEYFEVAHFSLRWNTQRQVGFHSHLAIPSQKPVWHFVG